MKITAVRTRPVRVPMTPPIVSRSGRFEAMFYLLVDVETDAAGGLIGSAYLWAFSKSGCAALKGVVDELAEVAIGEDPRFATRLWLRMWRKIAQWGHGGLSIIGMAAVDSAVWDVVGKLSDLPVAHLLGCNVDPVPAYASGGLWLIDDLDVLAREADDLKRQGFRAMKMRLGRSSIDADVAAVHAVREAIGPETGLMADVNSGWTVQQAIRAGRRLEPFGLLWIEDPVAYDDIEGHAAVAKALDTPVCFGEKLYGTHGCRQILERNAADILMLDLQRVGGVTGWVRIAGMAEGWDRPVCSHLFPELNVHLVASAPTAMFLEYMTWTEKLFKEPLELIGGAVRIPPRPGLGIAWNDSEIARMRPE